MVSEFKREIKFIIKLGLALHRYGASSFRIEAHLMSVTAMLGLQGCFLISPTSLTFVFWKKGIDEATIAAQNATRGSSMCIKLFDYCACRRKELMSATIIWNELGLGVLIFLD